MRSPGPAAAQEERDSIGIEDEEAVEQVATLLTQRTAARAEMRAIAMQPRHALPFLQPGRLARVLTSTQDAGAAGSGAGGAEREQAVHGTGERVRLLGWVPETRIMQPPDLPGVGIMAL